MPIINTPFWDYNNCTATVGSSGVTQLLRVNELYRWDNASAQWVFLESNQGVVPVPLNNNNVLQWDLTAYGEGDFKQVTYFKHINGTCTAFCKDQLVTYEKSVSNLVRNKTVSAATVNVGETATYTLTVQNTGPSVATVVQTTDALPAGMAYVSNTPSTGTVTVSGNTVNWTVASLAVGATATLTIVARATAAGTHLNTFEVTSQHGGTITGTNTATVTAVPVNIGITKTVSFINGSTNPNEAEYTVTVTNNGTLLLPSIPINDALNNGTTQTIVTAVPSAGSTWVLGGATSGGTWTITNLMPGASTTLQIRVDFAVTSSALGGSLNSNIATLTGQYAAVNTGNNSATAQYRTYTETNYITASVPCANGSNSVKGFVLSNQSAQNAVGGILGQAVLITGQMNVFPFVLRDVYYNNTLVAAAGLPITINGLAQLATYFNTIALGGFTDWMATATVNAGGLGAAYGIFRAASTRSASNFSVIRLDTERINSVSNILYYSEGGTNNACVRNI